MISAKTGIPAEILAKPSKLTDTEFQIIQAHCESAFRILESIEFPWPIAEAVYQHHERLDGSGYPRGLQGDEVSLEARILAALEEIRDHSGTMFDKQAVEACVALFEERGFSFDEPASS